MTCVKYLWHLRTYSIKSILGNVLGNARILDQTKIYHKNKKRPPTLNLQGLAVPLPRVDATGFEPATSASRTQRSTKLSHASL